jgi:hypothetical protein
MKTLTLASTRHARLSEAHSAYLSTAIARYREKAARAFDLARAARKRGNEPLALGLLDEAAAYHAMAQGLADQSHNTPGESR